jgi:hypothetical protein
MRRHGTLLASALLCSALTASAVAQTSPQSPPRGRPVAESSCYAAEQQGYTIARITAPGLNPASPLPIVEGEPVSVEELDAARDQLAAELGHRRDDQTYRFRYLYVTTRCGHFDATRATADVEFRADDVAIPKGDSAGAIIDEADVRRLDVLRDESTVGAGWNHDPRLGDAIGFDSRIRSDGGGEVLPVSHLAVQNLNAAFVGWKALDSGFYLLNISSALSYGFNAAGFYEIGDFDAWFRNLPFAEGTTSSKGFRFGGGWQWQYGRADLNLRAAYALANVGFDAPRLSQASHVRNGLEVSAEQEFVGHGRFARIGGWFDAGGGTRGGAFMRLFQDIALPAVSTNLDLTVSAGRAGDAVDLDRRFVGGNRLDPFLANKGSQVEELAWTGPVLRGHGVSDFYVPVADYTNRTTSQFAGISLTWSLPGWRKAVVRAIDVREREAVRETVQHEYDLAVVTLIQENVRQGMSGTRARARSELEARELKQALHNLMLHAHKDIVTPLLLVDSGWLTDHGFPRHATDGGLGVRLQWHRTSLELLYAKPLEDSLAGYPRSGKWLVRFSSRAAFTTQ